MRWTIAARWSFAAVLALEGACAEARAQAPAPAPTQDNSTATSVAEAARQASEKRKAAASAAKVITDDDINPNNVKPGEEGLTAPTARLETEPPPPAAVAAAEAADAKVANNPAGDPVKKEDSPKIKALKERLAQAEEDLKLTQRESALEQDTVYSKPDYQHDTVGKAKLEDLQQEISAHSQQVEELKALLAELEQAAEKEAGQTPSAQPPAAQTPSEQAAPPQR
jgi:hypothetical protein